MENQHRKITGYRELNESEISAMNTIKDEGGRLADIISTMEDCSELNVDRRWLSIGRTHLQEGLMALTRAIAKPTTFAVVLCALLAGCISPYKIPGTDDQFLVTKHSELRSPFGTNGGFDFLERCTGPDKVVLFYFEGDFTQCKPVAYSALTVGEECSTKDGLTFCTERSLIREHKSSQGQGGQIVSGMLNAAALGGVAAAAGSAGNAASSASSTVINNVTVPRGHHR